MSTNWFTGLPDNSYVHQTPDPSGATGGGNLQGTYTPTGGLANLYNTPIPNQFEAPSYTKPLPVSPATTLGGNNTPVATTTPVRGLTALGSTTQSTPATTSTPANSAPGAYPQVPTFLPSTYTQSTSPYYAGSTTQATLDSYLRNSVQALFDPSRIENGTAMADPTQMLTSLANNYLKLNPGAGSAADISGLVGQYAKQYTDWYNQSQDWYKKNAGSVALPGGSPFAAPNTPAATTPGVVNPYPYGANANTTQPASLSPTQVNNTNSGPTSSNNGSFDLQQFLSQFTQPQYHTVKTPLGYTQYQANVPQSSQGGLDPMSQLILSLLMGKNNSGGSQNSFWNLLAGNSGNGSLLG